MSWELSACLEYSGLEERWLKILEDIDIDSYETLESRIHDGDLQEALAKEAKNDEKDALQKLTSKECMDYVDSIRSFVIYIRENGIDPSSWRKTFADEGISNHDHLQKAMGNLEIYEKLTTEMNDLEKLGVQLIMGISSEAAGEHESKCVLDSMGLESKYWFPVFKNELHISHPRLFEYLTFLDCQVLLMNARHENESSIIKHHFMTENCATFSKKRQKDKEKSCKHFMEIHKYMHELQELLAVRQKNGQSNSDTEQKSENMKIRLRIENLRMLLNCRTEKFALATTQVTHDMLEEQMQKLDMQNVHNEDLCDNDVMEKASDGLILRGMCLLIENEERYVPRKRVLRPLPDFTLSKPFFLYHNDSVCFSSQNSQDVFLASLRFNGYSITVADRVEDGTERTLGLPNIKQVQCNQDSGYSLVKYFVIPTASGNFDKERLVLSDDALTALKKIEDSQELPGNLLSEKCKDYFLEYGSHVNTGYVHFGGIYALKVEYEGHLQESKELLNKVANDAITDFMEFDCVSYAEYSFSDTLKKKYKKFDFNKLSISVETIGGQPNPLSFLHWKSGLVWNSSSWAVIDRGFVAKGIWELLEQHKSSFSNYNSLARTLFSSWESITGLKATQLPNHRHLVEVPQRMQNLCTLIERSITDPAILKDCETHLDNINSEKDELIFISRRPDLWKCAAKDHSCILNFLNMIAQNKERYFKHKSMSVNFLFLQLVHGLTSNDFAGKEAIIQWVNGDGPSSRNQVSKSGAICLNFLSVVNKFVIPRLKIVGSSNCSHTSVNGHRICVTNDFAVFASDVLKKLQDLGEHHFSFLMMLLLTGLGYDISSKSFDVWLTNERVEIFLKDFDEKKKVFLKYREQSVKKIECYVLHVALEVAHRAQKLFSSPRKISQIMESMKNKFGLETGQIIEQYGSTPEQWKKIDAFVQSVLFGTVQDNENSEVLGASLDRIMQVPFVSPEICKIPVLKQVACNNSNALERNNNTNIMEILGLTDYFPSKITLQHVMQIPADKLESLQDIPWYVLQKLIMLDYKGRHIKGLPSDLKLREQNESETSANKKVDDDFVDYIFGDIDSVLEISPLLMPHPLDVLVAIFLCSSNFLRQVLAEKMYMCHVSIPVLLPDSDNSKLTYLLWTLRTVVCEYELSNGTAIETSIVNYNMPVVSFLRLGKVSRSKSKLLNDIINQGHNTFFHRDCASDVMPPKLSEGLVDVAWYLPSKQVKNDPTDAVTLTDAVTFLNLHGDGHCLFVQCNFFFKISSAIVVLVSIEELQNSDTVAFLKNLLKSQAKLVLIISNGQGSTSCRLYKQIFGACLKEVGQELKNHSIILDFNNSGRKNASGMLNEVISGILKSIADSDGISLAESKTFVESLGMSVDENDTECFAGGVFANEVFSCINRENLAAMKAEVLPLQGDLWHQWSKLEKAEHRREEKARTEHFAAELHEQKQALRRRQLQVCNNLSRPFESFLSKLLQVGGFLKLYFLKWLMIYFDESSRITLPSLIKMYSLKWSEINQYRTKRKDEADPYLMALQDELGKIEEKLAMTSLGLEHFMREVGQAFEAVTSLSSHVQHTLTENIHKLPRIMAELVLCGYPLEIMDGDASHVPLTWVTAVLSELKLMIGDKKIFVLSVLGVQSSGKSTLLNTMFGLQFAVSAGRCTRGVYAQLVPVPKCEVEACYDYILVVDTEGLRAPELGSAKHQHDNELAALAIGLGDMTVINIKGENPTEMQDVLQIVVHAFLRMQLVNKNLKLQPSCFFIHQNVGAINAAGKMIFGQQKLQDSLDQMTIAAAEQENVRGIYTFKEVIDFDVEKNVWYFSDLWQGDLPMAPANPGYSKKVCEVKAALFRDMVRRQVSSSLSTFCVRVKDLWRGILAENFVFSFKNSLELRAYDSLEVTLTDLSWTLQNDALEWFNNVRNRILSCEKSLDTLETNLSCEFSTYFLHIYDEVEKKLYAFYDKSDEKEILEQWKERSIIKLRDRRDETVRAMLGALKNEFEVRKSELSQNVEAEVYKEEIQSLAKKLALDLQGRENISDKELEKEFDNMWDSWMKTLGTKKLCHQVCDIEATVRNILYESLRAHSPLLSKMLKKSVNWHSKMRLEGNFQIVNDHIDPKRKYYLWCVASISQCLEMAFEILKNLFNGIEDFIKSLEGYNFAPAQAVTVIKNTCDKVDEVNRNSDMPFKFTILFKVELAIYVYSYAVFKFKKIHQDYLKEIDPKTVVERNYREQLLKLFKNKYRKSKNEKMVADLLSSCLLDAINRAVTGDMSRELANNVRRNVQCLHTKGSLLNNILKDLLKLKEFAEYHLYLSDIERCLKKWVRTYTNNYVFQRGMKKSKYAELAALKIKSLISHITGEIEKASKQFEVNDDIRISLQLWLSIFHSGISEKLPLPESKLSLVSKEQIEDIGFFKESLMNNLATVQKTLEVRANLITERYLDMQTPTVYSLLEKECLGCCEQCPFCKAPCSLTISEHAVKHSALQHYPQGAGRCSWITNNQLVIDNCSSLMCGDSSFSSALTKGKWHPYKNYQEIYPGWKIQADASMETSLYWKWFMANFAPQLARAYGAIVPDIPYAWTVITPGEAESSLDD